MSLKLTLLLGGLLVALYVILRGVKDASGPDGDWDFGDDGDGDGGD